MSHSTVSPQDRGRLLFLSVVMVTTMLMLMLDTRPLSCRQMSHPQGYHQGGASFLLRCFPGPETHILEEGQSLYGLWAPSCPSRHRSPCGN